MKVRLLLWNFFISSLDPGKNYVANIAFLQLRAIVSIKLSPASVAYKQVVVNIASHAFRPILVDVIEARGGVVTG